MKKRIEYIHGSYRGFLNGYLATSILGTKEEVIEQLNDIEKILTGYRPEVLETFFSIDAKRIEHFLQNPSDLVHALDIKQDDEKRKQIFQSLRDRINNESVSFKTFYETLSF